MQTNRREFERFRTPPGYTPVSVRALDPETADLDGHVYDLSEGGIQFEIDRALEPGTPISIELKLPAAFGPQSETLRATAAVIWTDNDEIDGPVRIAARFTGFARTDDRRRLVEGLVRRRFTRAA